MGNSSALGVVSVPPGLPQNYSPESHGGRQCWSQSRENAEHAQCAAWGSGVGKAAQSHFRSMALLPKNEQNNAENRSHSPGPSTEVMQLAVLTATVLCWVHAALGVSSLWR